ncbi:unnamed protein product, partial [marine sediment metagenome]
GVARKETGKAAFDCHRELNIVGPPKKDADGNKLPARERVPADYDNIAALRAGLLVAAAGFVARHFAEFEPAAQEEISRKV